MTEKEKKPPARAKQKEAPGRTKTDRLAKFEINAGKEKPHVLKHVKPNPKSFDGLATMLKAHIDSNGNFKAFFDKIAADFSKGSPHAPGMPRYSPDNVKQNVIKHFRAKYGMSPQDYLKGRDGKTAKQPHRIGGAVTETHLSKNPHKLKHTTKSEFKTRDSGRSDKSR